jgi:large subunit ribosomal protein L23
METYRIIRRPVITEKSNFGKMNQNKVTFEVDPKSNKSEIKKAIESIFKVKVLKVTTTTLPGKNRRGGTGMVQESRWKKATATLKQGDTIEFFEGA